MTASAPPPSPPAATSAWAPLGFRVFRMLWLAVLASNIGTWMQTVGAQWLLVDLPNAATLVALVQTADTLPDLLLALPGELLDRAALRRHFARDALRVKVGLQLEIGLRNGRRENQSRSRGIDPDGPRLADSR